MAREGIWVGKTQRTAVKIGDEWTLNSNPYSWGDLYSVDGYYRGWRREIDLSIIRADDPVTIYLYLDGRLVGYGPGYVDMSVSIPRTDAATVSGQFRSSDRWRRVPTTNLSSSRRRVGA